MSTGLSGGIQTFEDWNAYVRSTAPIKVEWRMRHPDHNEMQRMLQALTREPTFLFNRESRTKFGLLGRVDLDWSHLEWFYDFHVEMLDTNPKQILFKFTMIHARNAPVHLLTCLRDNNWLLQTRSRKDDNAVWIENNNDNFEGNASMHTVFDELLVDLKLYVDDEESIHSNTFRNVCSVMTAVQLYDILIKYTPEETVMDSQKYLYGDDESIDLLLDLHVGAANEELAEGIYNKLPAFQQSHPEITDLVRCLIVVFETWYHKTHDQGHSRPSSRGSSPQPVYTSRSRSPRSRSPNPRSGSARTSPSHSQWSEWSRSPGSVYSSRSGSADRRRKASLEELLHALKMQ